MLGERLGEQQVAEDLAALGDHHHLLLGAAVVLQGEDHLKFTKEIIYKEFLFKNWKEFIYFFILIRNFFPKKLILKI
jgi:hypothetical protein